MTIKYKMHNP